MHVPYLCPEVKEEWFKDDDEAQKWVARQVQPWIDTFPPRLDPENWKLSQWYYHSDDGTKMESCAEVEDKLERSSEQQPAALAIMGLETEQDSKRRKMANPEEKHKGLVNKVTSALQKLGKGLVNVEGRLPSLRRQMPATSYKSLREGMDACRICKEHHLDRLEDVKTFEPSLSECEQDVVLEQLTSMHADILKHCTALSDAVKVPEHALKEEVAPEPPSETGA